MDRSDIDVDTPPASDGRPRLVVCVAEPEANAFFPDETRADLAALGAVTWCQPDDVRDADSFAQVMEHAQVLVTAWGSPRLDAGRLAAARDLELVMHAASSLRAVTSDDFWATGIPISQAGAAMAPAVAELALTGTLSLLRRTHRLDHALRSGAGWDEARRVTRAREIGGARIGVIGASRTGRGYVESCRALGADVHVYDPYLPPDDALRPIATDLDTLLSGSDVVAVHAPATRETAGLIDAARIATIPDGAAVVNTARSEIVDMDALYDAVSSGRLDAALDVFDDEPLPTDDRWRRLPNVLLTPHVAGATVESRRRAGRIVVDEVRRHLAGMPLEHAVTRAQMERMG
ncbi:hydroxyacid dehydrogenase [Isoptericola hypogeus]|uniref:Hydroxyacid dehydrogenase n=1 Tax=Isoptericola hypogeus TaxID=300179 RepID=A0ABN2J6Z8_9MICO